MSMSEPRAEAIAELLPRSPQKCAEAFGKALLDPVLRQIPHGSVLRDQRARTQKCALPLATGDRRMACRWSNTRLDTRRAERERERELVALMCSSMPHVRLDGKTREESKEGATIHRANKWKAVRKHTCTQLRLRHSSASRTSAMPTYSLPTTVIVKTSTLPPHHQQQLLSESASRKKRRQQKRTE